MLYFIEGEKAITDQTLRTNGLNRLLDLPAGREHVSGPGGKPGLLVFDETAPGEKRFLQDPQTWEPRFGYPGTYVGIWRDQPPGNKELLRDAIIPGPEIELLDGQRWIVPLLREWRDDADHVIFDCKLPRVLKQSPETGALVSGDVIRAYKDLWDQSCSIADEMLVQMTTGSVRLETSKLDQFVGELLLTNYRVGLAEASILGLLDETLFSRILVMALDWDHLRALLKNLQSRLTTVGTKQGSDDTNLSSGGEPPTVDVSTHTDQPSRS